jgi:hypothetical protein
VRARGDHADDEAVEGDAPLVDLLERLGEVLRARAVVARLVSDVHERAVDDLQLAGRRDVAARKEARMVEQARLVALGVHAPVGAHGEDAEPGA